MKRLIIAWTMQLQKQQHGCQFQVNCPQSANGSGHLGTKVKARWPCLRQCIAVVLVSWYIGPSRSHPPSSLQTGTGPNCIGILEDHTKWSSSSSMHTLAAPRWHAFLHASASNSFGDTSSSGPSRDNHVQLEVPFFDLRSRHWVVEEGTNQCIWGCTKWNRGKFDLVVEEILSGGLQHQNPSPCCSQRSWYPNRNPASPKTSFQNHCKLPKRCGVQSGGHATPVQWCLCDAGWSCWTPCASFWSTCWWSVAWQQRDHLLGNLQGFQWVFLPRWCLPPRKLSQEGCGWSWRGTHGCWYRQPGRHSCWSLCRSRWWHSRRQCDVLRGHFPIHGPVEEDTLLSHPLWCFSIHRLGQRSCSDCSQSWCWAPARSVGRSREVYCPRRWRSRCSLVGLQCRLEVWQTNLIFDWHHPQSQTACWSPWTWSARWARLASPGGPRCSSWCHGHKPQTMHHHLGFQRNHRCQAMAIPWELAWPGRAPS